MMRKYEPLFGTVIEVHSREIWYVHRNPKESGIQRTPSWACRFRMEAETWL